MKSYFKLPFVLVILVGCSFALQAQWLTQSIELRPGWNAVYLEVQPEPRACDSIFADLPVEGVWGWNRRFNSVQFLKDPAEDVLAQPDWLPWLSASTIANGSSLFSLEGGKCYLIKLADNSQPKTLTLKGIPSLRPVDWLSESLNLVGFHVPSSSAPTFSDFFAGEPALAAGPFFKLSSSGHWEQVSNPALTPLQAGEAFWVKCVGLSRFQGPIVVELAQRNGLDYGRVLVEQTVRIRNASRVPNTIQVNYRDSLEPPNASSWPALAGSVPLRWWRQDFSARKFAWMPLDGNLSLTLPPGGEWVLRLEVRRTEMRRFALPAKALDARYQGLLEVTDSRGLMRQAIPVIAQGLQDLSVARPAAKQGAALHGVSDQLPSRRAGLWVGSVALGYVNQPSSPEDNLAQRTASEFQFRLIAHVDEAGNARLLQRVIQLRKPGSYKEDPDFPGTEIVDQPGEFVLITDDRKVRAFLDAGYGGAALRDGQAVGRRISSPAFSFSQPITMSAVGEFGSGIFSCRVPLGHNDPLNPFKHKYHPDHDNLPPTFSTKPEDLLPEGIESFLITRNIELLFSDTDPDGLELSGWGDSQIGGKYRETITGLHNHPLIVEGRFRLHQASRIGALTEQP